jgi:drug/metabolite transporter (DMT)-like permease
LLLFSSQVESGTGGLLGLLEIVFSILFGILLFEERLTWRVTVGGILIIIAAALPHLSGKKIK